jgi:HD-GYP domain-containing protein (c-di-GMP phosphodiesterase class II)
MHDQALERLTRIGIDLSAEHDVDRLLEQILEEARALTSAEAATLYQVDTDAGLLHFKILQNERLGTRMAGKKGRASALPSVPLSPENVSGYVALACEPVNIADVYEAEGFDFSGPREYDRLTGYRCRSMLVLPIQNHEEEVIGVLQLINARRGREIVDFSRESVQLARALASQAGIALTNAHLIQDLKSLLEGLIEVMADAIDEKSAHTAGHIRRVTQLSAFLAEAVNACEDGLFDRRAFTQAELEELRIAGLLHDIGKIVIPEHVVDKATKLECIYDRIHEIRTRFSVIRRGVEIRALERKLAATGNGVGTAEIAVIEEERREALSELESDLSFLENINPGGESMAPDRIERLHRIAARSYRDDQGCEQPYLTENEVRNLSIPRGTLLPEELARIRAHAATSVRLLSRIPFPRKLRNVPRIAGDHHEALDGSGYPFGKTAGELPLQSRILAVADIFDALTASDRPYKKAYPLDEAYRILRSEAAGGRLDERLVELFIGSGVAHRLAEAAG